MNKVGRFLIMHRSQHRLDGLTLQPRHVPSHIVHAAFVTHVSMERPSVKAGWKYSGALIQYTHYSHLYGYCLQYSGRVRIAFITTYWVKTLIPNGLIDSYITLLPHIDSDMLNFYQTQDGYLDIGSLLNKPQFINHVTMCGPQTSYGV